MKNENNSELRGGLALGLCLGLSVGLAIGAATHNMGTWLPMGMSLGLLWGRSLFLRRRV